MPRSHGYNPGQETLDARSQYTSNDADGRSHFRVNQYVIKDEIGRGSYGAVHLATDQFGNEYVSGKLSGLDRDLATLPADRFLIRRPSKNSPRRDCGNGPSPTSCATNIGALAGPLVRVPALVRPTRPTCD